MDILEILETLGTKKGNEKKTFFKEHKTQFLQQIVNLTYDRVKYVFGVSLKTLVLTSKGYDTLEFAVQMLREQNLTRAEIEALGNSLNTRDLEVFKRIIDRDLKVGINTTLWNSLLDPEFRITKPAYQRCSQFSEKSKVQYPAILQLKADGKYCEIQNLDSIHMFSRAGEEMFLDIKESFKTLPKGIYLGEVLLKSESNRAKANGILNSDDIPQEDVELKLWDFLSLEEYKNAKNKVKNTVLYETRFKTLENIVNSQETKNIQVIPSHEVQNLQEALDLTANYMQQGLEGGVLKNKSSTFKDGVSTEMFKLKVFFSLDLRVTGFTEGKKGTKREETFGALSFSSDDGKIKGQCSGFTDKDLEYFNKNRDIIIGKIIEVQGNDLTNRKDNDFYAISHPRFIELRNDKTETDDLKSAFKSLESSKKVENLTLNTKE